VWVDIQGRRRHRRRYRSRGLLKDCFGLQEIPLSSWPLLRITSTSCIPGHELSVAAEVGKRSTNFDECKDQMQYGGRPGLITVERTRV
jgi:hypothetical protein